MNQNQTEAFIQASTTERNYLNHYQQTNEDFNILKITSISGYCVFDCFAQSALTQNWAIEVKIRTYKRNELDSAYIKCRKYYQMKEKCQTQEYINKNVQPIYMMFFKCGTIAIWNLFKAKRKFKLSYHKLYNCINSPVVRNKLFELDFNDATFYRWK